MADEGYSLDDTPTGAPTPDTFPLDQRDTANLPEDVVSKRAARADYGLGDVSPGKDALQNSITAGSEDTSRATASAERDMKETAAAAKRMLGVTMKTSPVTQNDVDLYKGSQTPKLADPGVVFELSYGTRLVTDIASASPDPSAVMNKVQQVNPEGAHAQMDFASDIITKQQITNTMLENRKADWQGTSWADSAISLGEQFVPLLSAVRLHDVAGVDSSILPGSNLEDQVKGLLLLPPSAYKAKLEEVVDSLYNKNPLDAIKFMEAIKSYSSEDAFLDTAFGIADAVGVGQGVRGVPRLVGAITKSTAKLTAEQTAEITQRQAAKALKDAIKASSKDPGLPEDIFAAVGQVDKAADISALRKVGVLPTEGMTDAEVLTRNLPSVARVNSIVSDAGTLSREATDRLAAKLNVVVVGTEDALGVTVRNTRLTPEQLQVAVQEGKDALRREFEKSSDAIIDIRHNPIEASKSNNESLTIELGATNATPFPTSDLAEFYAREMYGLDEGQYRLTQRGTDFTIEVDRNLDETSKGVRDAAITTKNTDGAEGIPSFFDFLRQPNRILPSFLKGADENLPEFQNQQRKIVQAGFNNTLAIIKDLVKPIAELGTAEKRDLEKVLKYNRDFYNSKTGDRGFFYENISALEDGYMDTVKRLPTEKEVEAYFLYTQASDLDWGLRNMSLYRDKARLGLNQFSVEFMKTDEAGTTFPRTPRFEGREVDNLPWSGEIATVLHFDEGGKNVSVFDTRTSSREYYQDLIDNKGYKVVQVDNPVNRPFAEALDNREVIQYVLTKDYKKDPLSFKQLDYNPGGHVEYQHDWFLKQPRITTGRGGQKFYEGDTAILNFSTEAQTKKFEKSFNTARELLKGKSADLDAFVSKNLPYTVDQFRALFKGEEGLDLNAKFHTAKRGTSLLDDQKYIRAENPGIRNFTDSSHNLNGDADRKFVGAKNGPLMTITNSGTNSNPLLRFSPSKLIDPLQTMGRSLSNAANNRFFGDYKIGAVEDFITRYGDTLKTPTRELQNFPLQALYNPDWNEKFSAYGKVAEAKAARRAIMQFIGEQNTLGRNVEAIKQKLYNSVFNSFGEDFATKVVDKLSSKTGDAIDPAGYFRAVGFHTKLGMFNPMQLPLQAMGATHAIAISPKNGLNAAISYWPTRALGHNPSELLIEAASKKMEGFGWKSGEFAESVKTMRSLSWDSVGSEHVWKDNIADPKVFAGKVDGPKSAAGWTLDKGAVFFNEGEKINRIIGWHTAYKDWREANPLRTLDTQATREILNRADLLTANMTRASSAAWQKGLLSIPTQFLGFQARLVDQFMGKRLTSAEKIRAFGMNSLMYGVPAATAGATGWTAYEDLRSEALKRGWPVDNVFFKALHEGIISTAAGVITGTDLNIADRYGPGGFKPIKEAMNGDKTILALLGGASGSIASDMWSSGVPALKDFYEAQKTGGSYEPVLQDVILASKNISSINSAFSVMTAMNTGKYFTKNGKSVGDMTGMQAMVKAITGLQPQEFTDYSLGTKINIDQKKLDDVSYKEWERAMRQGQQAFLKGDIEGQKALTIKAKAITVAAGWNADKWSKFIQRYIKDNGDQMDTVNDIMLKNAPVDQYKARLDQRIGN